MVSFVPYFITLMRGDGFDKLVGLGFSDRVTLGFVG